MPIYEFYCAACHTLYSFFTATSSSKRPSCPGCGRTGLERRPSSFAMLKHGGDEDDVFADLDDRALESAMSTLASEMAGFEDSEDPRVVGRALRRFGELSGLELGGRMEEALERMEAGEDLDSVEADLDLAGEGDDDSLDDLFRLKSRLLRARKKPRVDDTLHFL